MIINDRSLVARFYDLNPDFPKDIPFYITQIASRDQSILELGCGTGRVLIPLSNYCGFIQGIDISESMISICREKMRIAGLTNLKAKVDVADICSFSLKRHYDLMIAPFRVLQNLETEKEVQDLFRCIRTHMKEKGSCIINVFRPFGNRQEIIKIWSTAQETLEWEVPYEDGKITRSSRRARIDPINMILYPEIIYRIYKKNLPEKEIRHQIAMKCYWPDELEGIIETYGFRIEDRWGGYENEKYGEGPELIIKFGL